MMVDDLYKMDAINAPKLLWVMFWLLGSCPWKRTLHNSSSNLRGLALPVLSAFSHCVAGYIPTVSFVSSANSLIDEVVRVSISIIPSIFFYYS